MINSKGDKKLIIDTKYYEHTIQVIPDSITLPLYPAIFTPNIYLCQDSDKSSTGKVAGVLLHSKTDVKIPPNNDFNIGRETRFMLKRLKPINNGAGFRESHTKYELHPKCYLV